MVPQWSLTRLSSTSFTIRFFKDVPRPSIFFDRCERPHKESISCDERPTPKLYTAGVRDGIGALEFFQQILVVEWLRTEDREVDWSSVIEYVHSMTHRTYENSPVACNIVITKKILRPVQ